MTANNPEDSSPLPLQAIQLGKPGVPLWALILVPLSLNCFLAFVFPFLPVELWRYGIAFGEIAVVVIPTIVFLALSGVDFRRFGISRPRLWLVIPGMAFGLGTTLLSIGLDGILERLLPEFIYELLSLNYENALRARDIWEWTALVAVIGLAGPLFEEVLFRGLIQDSLIRRLSVWAAMLLNALLFALFHLNILQFLVLFGLGYLYTYLAVRGRQLTTAIMAHATHNSLVLLALNLNLLESNDAKTTLISLGLGSVFFVSAMLLFLLLTKETERITRS